MIYKSTTLRQHNIIKRDSLSDSILEDDYQLKNLSSNTIFKEFLNVYHNPVSIQWIYLKPEGKISIHNHEVDTLLIACRGKCNLIGEMESAFEEGDAIVIPKFIKHGLSNLTNECFWGISVRF